MKPDDESSREELERRIQEREKRMAETKARLQQAEVWERTERVDRITSRVKLTALGIGAIIVLSGVVWGVSKLADLAPNNECGFHEHASFRVFDGLQELSFQHPRFDMSKMAMKAHLHQPNDYQIHLEGACADVSNFFALMGMKLRAGYLKLDPELHDGRVLENDGNESLRFFLYRDAGGNGTWEEFPELPGHQLRDNQRALIAYGSYTSDQIATMQARVPVL